MDFIKLVKLLRDGEELRIHRRTPVFGRVADVVIGLSALHPSGAPIRQTQLIPLLALIVEQVIKQMQLNIDKVSEIRLID